MAVIDDIFRRYGIHRARPEAQFQPLSPDEEDSVLETLGQQGLQGLSYVGSTLDKVLGGRAVRGALGGNKRDLLSVIPGSDMMGLTDPDKAVSGRDLGQKWGWMGPDQEGFDWGDLGGMGIEIGLDPSTYLSFGASALNKAGLAAEKAGTLGKTVAERIAKRQGGHVGVGLPFMGNAATFDLGPLGRAAKTIGGAVASPVTGPAIAGAKWVNNQTGGKLGEGLADAGRSLKALFDTSKAGQTSAEGQRLAPEIVEARVAEEARHRMKVAKVGRMLGLNQLQDQELAYLVEETTRRANKDPQALAAWQAASPEMRQAVDLINQDLPAMLGDRKAYGGRVGELQSDYDTDYFPGQVVEAPDEGDWLTNKSGGTPFDPTSPHDIRRDNTWDLPRGLRQLETEVIADPQVTSWNRTIKDPALVAKRLHDVHGVETAEMAKLKKKTREAVSVPGAMGPARPVDDWYNELVTKEAAGTLDGAEKEALALGKTHYADPLAKAKKLGDVLGKLSPDRLPVAAGGKGLGFKGRNPLASYETYGSNHARAMAATEIGSKALAEAALPTAQAAGPGSISVRSALAKMGLTAGDKKASTQQQILGPLLDHWVPAELADSLTNGARAFMVPDAAKGIVKLFRDFTDFFKKGVTTPFPAFHSRNFASAAWMNMTLGVKPFSQSYKDARRYLRGEKMSAQDIEWANEAFAHRITGANFLDLSGPAADTGEDILRRIPGVIPRGTGKYGLAGDVGGKLKSEFKGKAGIVKAPLAAGVEAGNAIEDTMRLAAYIDLRKKGFKADVAAAKVRAAHVDYNDLTAFEKKFMRPMIPFYCVPDHSEVLTRDGWKTCDNLQVGEDVLTYNLADDCTEWQPCLDKAIFDCNMPIMALQNTRHKLQFTHEHRWPVEMAACTIKGRSHATYKYQSRRKVVIGRKLNSGHRIIVAAEVREEDSLLTPEQARLLGWLVTDGYCRQRGNYLEAVIYQHPKKFLAEVCEVAGGTPRSPHPDTGVVCVPVLKDRVEAVKPSLLKKNSLVKVVTRLSTEAAKAMYDAMYKADGTTSENRPNDFFAAEHEGVREAFRVLATMLGKRVSESDRGCYVSHNRYLKVFGCKLAEEQYKGRVWCPRTENGTWVMRQNGMITITGNTFARKNIPHQLKQIMEQPGGMTANAIKLSADARDAAGEGFTPEYLGAGATVPLGEEEDGNQRFLTQLGLPFEQPFDVIDPGSAQRTGERLLSQLNPLIKAPLEYISGKQFYSGRELDKLYDDGLPFPQARANAPTARFEGLVKMLFDPRKNLLTKLTQAGTGLKQTDVNMPQQRALEARRITAEMLGDTEGVRTLSKFYVPEGEMENLTPAEILLMRLSRTQEKRARELAEAKQQGRAR